MSLSFRYLRRINLIVCCLVFFASQLSAQAPATASATIVQSVGIQIFNDVSSDFSSSSLSTDPTLTRDKKIFDKEFIYKKDAQPYINIIGAPFAYDITVQTIEQINTVLNVNNSKAKNDLSTLYITVNFN